MKTRKVLGAAKRVSVRLPFGAKCQAWDCRRFGFGRVVAPKLPVQIELVPGTLLHLSTGVVSEGAGADVIAA